MYIIRKFHLDLNEGKINGKRVKEQSRDKILENIKQTIYFPSCKAVKRVTKIKKNYTNKAKPSVENKNELIFIICSLSAI